ncbi:MAG: metallopeptidase family protein [Actinomycetota bacterium]
MWLSPERFEEMVTHAVDALPEWVHERLDNVELFVEDEPPPGQHLLGLYEGVPLLRRASNYTNVMPDRITLFKHPIEREGAFNEDRIQQVVSHTVAHELAHHFGISDERLLEIDAY